MYNLRTL